MPSEGEAHMNKKVVIGLGIGCVVLCVVSIIVMIAGGAFLYTSVKEPENAYISVDVPVRATKDESVTIELHVENTGTESQLLHSVDISSEYLAGIAILESDPPFVESSPIPFFDFQSYWFEQEISPGAKLVVRFLGVAVNTGDYSGVIDVCIKSGSNCRSFATRTIVEE